jgi:hypothetical protein
MNLNKYFYYQRITVMKIEAIACKPGFKYLVIINYEIDNISY